MTEIERDIHRSRDGDTEIDIVVDGWMNVILTYSEIPKDRWIFPDPFFLFSPSQGKEVFRYRLTSSFSTNFSV